VGTEARVCADIARRQRLGIAKYGTTVHSNPLPLRAWLQHAYEETLDTAVYLRRAIEDLDSHSANALATVQAAQQACIGAGPAIKAAKP
jgi:hypothetical protein